MRPIRSVWALIRHQVGPDAGGQLRISSCERCYGTAARTAQRCRAEAQLEPGSAMSYLDRNRNDARAPLKAVRFEAGELVVREATIMK